MTSPLVVVITHPRTPRHPYDGMILCLAHLMEMRYDVEPTYEKLSQEEINGLHHECPMCSTVPSHNRQCMNETCSKKLYPQWPSVYCSNECAWSDV